MSEHTTATEPGREEAGAAQAAAPIAWTRPEWQAEAHTWIQAQLAEQQMIAAGDIAQVHVRPWSSVLRVPTTAAELYFKACAPALSHEPALTQVLSQWRPDCIPNVVAIDAARGWLLMRDCGVTLRSVTHGIGDLYHWRELLPQYARLQIETAPRAAELLALGVPDRRPAALPAQFGRLLGDATFLHVDQPDGLSAKEHDRLLGFMPHFAALCEELAAGEVPPALHHDDFHDGNIFVQDARYIFTDWGEAFVAHPFFSMVVAQRSIANTLDLEPADPLPASLCEQYLKPWTQFAPPDRLHELFLLAQHAGMVCRALTWYQVVSGLPEPEQSAHRGAVISWLREVLALVKRRPRRGR